MWLRDLTDNRLWHWQLSQELTSDFFGPILDFPSPGLSSLSAGTESREIVSSLWSQLLVSGPVARLGPRDQACSLGITAGISFRCSGPAVRRVPNLQIQISSSLVCWPGDPARKHFSEKSWVSRTGQLWLRFLRCHRDSLSGFRPKDHQLQEFSFPRLYSMPCSWPGNP